MKKTVLKNISIKAIAVGSITTIASSLVLSILMPFVFIDLVKTGKIDVLISSFWPQIYTLGLVLVSGIFGIYIGSVVANRVKWINSTAIVLVSFLLTYIINQPVSDYSNAYPVWFTVSSYLLCGSSLFIGHYLSKILIKIDAVNATS